MFIEQIWPYLPTPLVYAVVVGEALAALLLIQNYALLAMVFLWALASAFVLGAWLTSRPFHLERLAVLLTLAIAHTVLFAVHISEVYELLHLHDDSSRFYARVAYSITWLCLTGAALVSYALSTGGANVARIWPFAVGLLAVVTLFPLDPDAFVVNQPAWLWVLRVHLSFTTFLLVSVGDAATIWIFECTERTLRWRSGHHASAGGVPDHTSVDVSLLRTVVWSPITLWIMFVPRVLLLLCLLLLPYLCGLLVSRWRRAKSAHITLLQHIARTIDPSDNAQFLVTVLTSDTTESSSLVPAPRRPESIGDAVVVDIGRPSSKSLKHRSHSRRHGSRSSKEHRDDDERDLDNFDPNVNEALIDF